MGLELEMQWTTQQVEHKYKSGYGVDLLDN